MTAAGLCIFRGGGTAPLTQCLRFTLIRDRYLPYASLHAVFLAPDIPTEQPLEILFSVGGQTVHDGMIQKSEYRREKGRILFTVTSKSYTSLLTKNQLAPGIQFQVTLQSLLSSFQLPNITLEGGMDEVRYVYIKSNTAIWDSVIAYNFKLNGRFPLIRVPNKLCVLPRTDTDIITLPANAILTAGEGGESGEMISRIEMANAAGDYGTYSMDNPEAAVHGIVRIRQIALDMQYLYDPNDALSFRIKLGNRKMFCRSVSYAGYCGEDLEDIVSVNSQSARVSRIVLSGNEKGIVTADTFYYDDFCNPQ